MTNLMVLPINEDSFNSETNLLDLTVFMAFTSNGKITLKFPENISKLSGYGLYPLGIDNFIPKSLDNTDFSEIQRDVIINNVQFESTFPENEVSTFKFNKLSDNLLAYPIKTEEDYYIGVLKVSLDLINLDFSYKISNIVEMKNEIIKNTIRYFNLDLKIEDDFPESLRELHEVSKKLQFASFNDEFHDNLRDLLNLFIISKSYLTSKDYTEKIEEKDQRLTQRNFQK